MSTRSREPLALIVRKGDTITSVDHPEFFSTKDLLEWVKDTLYDEGDTLYSILRYVGDVKIETVTKSKVTLEKLSESKSEESALTT